jgi:tRNA pseudouridine65 synthase
MDRPLRDLHDARSDARKHERERDAVTEFETVDWFELPFSDGAHETSRYSLLKLKPRTGRRHQIRRHLKHASHPIVGDTTHGDHRHNKRWAERFELKRMLLAASRLSIRHPSTGAELESEAALGDEFAKVLAAIQPNRVAR